MEREGDSFTKKHHLLNYVRALRHWRNFVNGAAIYKDQVESLDFHKAPGAVKRALNDYLYIPPYPFSEPAIWNQNAFLGHEIIPRRTRGWLMYKELWKKRNIKMHA